MIAVARNEVSDAQMAIFAASITDALTPNPIFINDQVAELTDDPQIVYNDGTSSRKCKPVD